VRLVVILLIAAMMYKLAAKGNIRRGIWSEMQSVVLDPSKETRHLASSVF
jgi:hypothetical protein